MERELNKRIAALKASVDDKSKELDDSQRRYEQSQEDINRMKEQATKDASRYKSQGHALEEMQQVVGKYKMPLTLS